jgi:alkylation response protein AidB-like acyl-CoA dehydrogenase
MPMLRFGSDFVKEKYLTRAAKGELLGCFGMTEPDVGSDAASMETFAKKDGDMWVLNGNKMWISNGGIADVALVFAQTDKEKRHRGITAFLVERDTEGFSSSDIHGKMGLRDSNTAELVFEDVKVPEQNIIGKHGEGFKVAMYALDCARLSTAAACVGIAQASLEASVNYAKERKQFGRTIAGFQLIQEMIADMVAETEAARWFVYRCGYLKDRNIPFIKEASIAKYYASEVAVRAARRAIKIHGSYGYINDYPVERYYRDATGLSIYEGTAEIQKLIIGREILGTSAFV